MCIQIYRRCICGHSEDVGAPKRCDKATKASRIWSIVPFGKIDGKGYCLKKKQDSYGVPEPCKECKAEGGIVTRLSEPTRVNTGYYDRGSAYRGGAKGLAPLPPAHLSPSPYSNERHHGRAQMSSRYDTQTQQPAQRAAKYENPRQPPPPPSRSTKYAPESDKYATRQSEEYVRKTIRDAEKVSREIKKTVTLGRNDKIDDIRTRALAKAMQDKRHVQPSTNLRHGSNNIASAYPAPLNISKRRAPANPQDVVYPDIRRRPALKSDVQFAAQHEAVHYDEETRRFQDSTVRWGATSHPDRYRQRPTRDARRYATRTEADRFQQQPSAAPRRGYGADVNTVYPLTYSPPESEISAINVTQKLPYTHRRR